MPYWDQWHETFETYVRDANPHFERFAFLKSSSLRPLIDELKRGANARPQAITSHLQALQREPDAQRRTKANKYKDALYHLAQQLNIAAEFSVGCINTTRVCLFARSAVPVSYQPLSRAEGGRGHVFSPTLPERRDVTRMVVPSSLRDLLPEDSIARGWIDGIVVIHMGKFEAGPMNATYDGWKAIDHMNSVLRVGARRQLPLAVVTINNAPTCAELKEANAYPGARMFSSQQGEHCGWHDPGFRVWMSGRRRVLIMGFDGSVCVRANLFGCVETVERAAGVGPDVGRMYRPHDAANYKVVAPLVSVANVETSRALIPSVGALSSAAGEWGPLNGL